MLRLVLVVGAVVVGLARQGAAAPPDDAAVRDAVVRGLRIVQKGARNYPEHRECFSCHHQTLPLLAMRAGDEAGFPVDRQLFREQTEFSRAHFINRLDDLRQGKNIGGRAGTASYGLWTFEIARTAPDDVSEAIAINLVKTQERDGRWRPSSLRPPMMESHIACTVLSLYGLQLFGDASTDVERAVERAQAWLDAAPVENQEDRVFLLWGRQLLGASEGQLDSARQMLLDAQRADGGWSQNDDLESDAYATGEALFVLQETGFPQDDPRFQAGVRFLLETQAADGSWKVVTRAKPVQVYFDNGDPYGESQFISMAATGWAVAALARTLPDVPRPAPLDEPPAPPVPEN